MKYKVFHVVEPTFQPTVPTDFPKGFEMVAEVVTDLGLEDVYRVTNHVNDPWWENPEVKVHRKRRSTSVGDVVEDETGKRFLCNLAGWMEI
jgi:hypothetical protein